MSLCSNCQKTIDEPEPEPVVEPEPVIEPEIKRRGRPSTIQDKVAQKKIYNSRYYSKCKLRVKNKDEEDKEI